MILRAHAFLNSRSSFLYLKLFLVGWQVPSTVWGKVRATCSPLKRCGIWPFTGAKVWIKTLQVVLACTDSTDGRVNPVAFTIHNSPVRDRLSRNRFVIDLAAVSTGRIAAVHIRGTLGSNGRGSARIRLLGNSTDSDTGERLEECEREVTIAVRRGPR